MANKPQIAMVGPGNLGTAIAISLKRAGYAIDLVIGRPTASSQKKARSLAKEVHAKTQPGIENARATVLWICVPDAQITDAAETLARDLSDAKRVIVLHSSGALTSDVLGALRKKGAAVAALHPLMTFVRRSRPSLAGVPFAVEGDSRALRQARQIVRDLGGHAYSISKKHKAAYHAWGAFASPLFTALLAASEETAALAGIHRKSARRRMIPILMQTLANYASFGPAGAFSGPIIRGDVETIKKHLSVLRKVPAARDTYIALAQSALHYLPSKNTAALKKILSAREH